MIPINRDEQQSQQYSYDVVSQREIHELAVRKGWWPEGQDPRARIPECLMLIVTEASEAMEDWRDDLMGGIHNGKPVGFSYELADIVIRCRDLAEALGIDLEAAITLKHAYNGTRPVLHGRRR